MRELYTAAPEQHKSSDWPASERSSWRLGYTCPFWLSFHLCLSLPHGYGSDYHIDACRPLRAFQIFTWAVWGYTIIAIILKSSRLCTCHSYSSLTASSTTGTRKSRQNRRQRSKDLRIINPKIVKNFKKYSFFGKNLRFGACIIRKNWHLWRQNGDTNLSKNCDIL